MPAPRDIAAYSKWKERIASSQRKRLATVGVWNKGLKGAQAHNADTRLKMSETHRKQWANMEPEKRSAHAKSTSKGLQLAVRDGRYVGGMKGKRHSNKTKRAIRASNSTPAVRAKHSKDYSRFTSKQTKPEMLLSKHLDGRRWKFVGARVLNDGNSNSHWLKYDTPISADFINTKAHILVMVDGCYWHECPQHGSGKFLEKPEADRQLTQAAVASGWVVIRIWEHEILHDASGAAARLSRRA